MSETTLWTLPQSNIRVGERLEAIARKTVESATRCQPHVIEQVYVFDTVSVDAQESTISVVYLALVNTTQIQDVGSDHPDNGHWHPIVELPAMSEHTRRKAQTVLNHFYSTLNETDTAIEYMARRKALIQSEPINQ